MILDKKVYISRLTPNSGDTDREQYVAVDGLGNVPINIQPASSEVVAIADGAYGQTFTAYTPVSGMALGDMVTVSGVGTNYIIKGIRDWYFPPLPHYELLLFEADL